MNERCACGEPLHYTSPAVEENTRRVVDELGENVMVRLPTGSWRVPRHYIALHGLVGSDLPALAERLGFERVS